MLITFYIAAVVAVTATLMMVTRANAVHALLYLIVSLLAVAVIFYLLGAYFVAALEVIIYAGAIMVFFVFAIMLLNLGPESAAEEKHWLTEEFWLGPVVLVAVLLGEFLYVLVRGTGSAHAIGPVLPKQVGIALYGPYVLAVELASMLLLAGLVGALHLGRRDGRTAGRGGES
jgi:NADH-quinone oxidoreductase subunit J